MEIMVAISLLALALAIAVAIAIAFATARALRAGGAARQEAESSQLLQVAAELRDSLLAEQRAAHEAALSQVMAVAHDSLSAQAEAVVVKTSADLSGRKALIDQRLGDMADRLERLSELMVGIDNDRQRSFGELAGRIQEAARTTESLAKVTGSLHEAISSSQARGQWGERLAEDVLQAAGFVEGVSYHRERAIDGAGRPDFTFVLPGDRLVHMDAKFPLAAYLRYLEADVDSEREAHRKRFMRDASDRVKELVGRGYVNPSQQTVDFMIMFIPNESIYQFICQTDPDFLDRALAQKVVCCSPMTLFAVLGVIRQAVDNFRFEQRSREVLDLLVGFTGEYEKFMEQVDKVGSNLRRTEKAFDHLNGPRRRQLQRTLDRIDDVRREGEVPDRPELATIDGRDLARQAEEGVA